MSKRQRGGWVLAVLCATSLAGGARADDADELSSLSIEELGNIPVTSVFKRPEPVAETPASVYVITQEEIRRSGAVSLPEVLRLAPNLEVARVDAASYAISARGFNTFEASNKLLVLIDGRSAYTPLHAGVYWDQQQMNLQDIERIEVVSGPGGALWGSNAVNGVINIITRTAQQSTGTAVEARVGTRNRGISGRLGGSIGENGAVRVYGMGFERDGTVDGSGASLDDDWRGTQVGFRTDWFASGGQLTLQGDAFRNTFDAGDIAGGNFLTRWQGQISERSHLELQAYYDRVVRDVDQIFDSLETIDFALQHSLALGARHQLAWGLGHRITWDRFVNSANVFQLVPSAAEVQLSNVFMQDTIALSASTALTVGSKFEYSTFSGVEALPSARLAWQATDSVMLWTAASRAVRTPSRIDRDLTAPGILDLAVDFDAEVVNAYELGYRGQLTPRVALSASLYYNDYDRLRMLVLRPNGRFQLANAMQGSTQGIEAWADYQLAAWWRLAAGLNLLDKDLTLDAGSVPAVLTQHAGNDPHHQYFLRSSMDLPHGLELDLNFRAVGALTMPAVPAYNQLGARLGWRFTPNLQISLSGSNLLDSWHPETGNIATRSEIPRGVRLELAWRGR